MTTLQFRLSVLGHFELCGPDGPIDLAIKKHACLLGFLACTLPAAHSRDHLMTLLWGTRFDAHARQNLRQALYRLRRILGPQAILTTGDRVSLRPNVITCDAARFATLIQQGGREALRKGIGLYKGRLLGDCSTSEEAWHEWLNVEAQRLERMAVDAMVKLGELELGAGHTEDALQSANQALAISNLREDAHRLLIRTLVASGRRAEALKHCEQIRSLLKSELDAEPDEATLELEVQLREASAARDLQARGLSLPDRPSIAILPFENMSDDPQQAYFADGIVEDITTALSRLRWLFVVARNSSFIYRPPTDVQQVGRELGVRYVLEGSVRKADQRIRISAQLIDAQTRAHIWADRYDGDLSDIFALQDTITGSVIAAVEPNLHLIEAKRAKSKPPTSLDAYDHYLRALAELGEMTRGGFQRAEAHLRQALNLEANYAEAMAMLADCILRQATSGWMRETGAAHAEARDLARRAATLEPESGTVLATAAWALAGTHEWDEAQELAERASRLQPSSAHVRFRCGAVFGHCGESERAIFEHMAAWRLNPKDRRGYHPHVGIAAAHFFAGRFDEAIRWARRGVAETSAESIPRRYIAAALAHLDRLPEAREEIAALLKVQPTSCLARSRKSSFRHQWMHQLYVDGLRKAGLPEQPP